MPKIIKSCSLDERTIDIANSKDNFSEWVREQLLNEIEYTLPCSYFPLKLVKTDLGHIIKEAVPEGEVCNGVRKPTCKTCWPDGKPESKDWLEYVERRIDLSELRERTRQHWSWRKSLEKKRNLAVKNHINDPKRGGEKPKRAYVRRLLTWIWSFIW